MARLRYWIILLATLLAGCGSVAGTSDARAVTPVASARFSSSKVISLKPNTFAEFKTEGMDIGNSPLNQGILEINAPAIKKAVLINQGITAFHFGVSSGVVTDTVDTTNQSVVIPVDKAQMMSYKLLLYIYRYAHPDDPALDLNAPRYTRAAMMALYCNPFTKYQSVEKEHQVLEEQYNVYLQTFCGQKFLLRLVDKQGIPLEN